MNCNVDSPNSPVNKHIEMPFVSPSNIIYLIVRHESTATDSFPFEKVHEGGGMIRQRKKFDERWKDVSRLCMYSAAEKNFTPICFILKYTRIHMYILHFLLLMRHNELFRTLLSKKTRGLHRPARSNTIENYDLTTPCTESNLITYSLDGLMNDESAAICIIASYDNSREGRR